MPPTAVLSPLLQPKHRPPPPEYDMNGIDELLKELRPLDEPKSARAAAQPIGAAAGPSALRRRPRLCGL